MFNNSVEHILAQPLGIIHVYLPFSLKFNAEIESTINVKFASSNLNIGKHLKC